MIIMGRPRRPAQRDALQPTARCVVLEAETGSGRTEAALWRFRTCSPRAIWM
jgi:CRISPR/Cas system-associated endonuclease/helicase Cas3